MEFRSMRRFKQLLSKEACEEMLNRNTSGVLAVLGDGGYPYTVPISYYYEDGVLYFHCAKEGHKLDAIKACDKVSFCVIDQDQVVQEEYTSHFRSVVAFGRARLVDEEEMRGAIVKLAMKYVPDDSEEHRTLYIDREFAGMAMIRVDIDHMTGKEAIELVRAR